eukprot:CAMPEP_0183732302 /NCGR_PEP_ID=MMETSP0737-20130205/38125_1 /TAXON_ID=385413 /ORGANISM="Thalassiosira miniscula, Strain CCMP1093" /LENGTH=132 /DNA_ID=CAMNT_0025965281 /DNA_START=100 /DNA_END=494 /DNA_ORIENTATION=+
MAAAATSTTSKPSPSIIENESGIVGKDEDDDADASPEMKRPRSNNSDNNNNHSNTNTNTNSNSNYKSHEGEANQAAEEQEYYSSLSPEQKTMAMLARAVADYLLSATWGSTATESSVIATNDDAKEPTMAPT